VFNFTPDQDIRIDMALLNLGRLRALRYERNRFNAATRPVDGQYPGMQWCLQWWYPCFQAKFRIHKQITTRLHEAKHVFFVRLIVFHFGGQYWFPANIRRFLEICSSCGLEAQPLLLCSLQVSGHFKGAEAPGGLKSLINPPKCTNLMAESTISIRFII